MNMILTGYITPEELLDSKIDLIYGAQKLINKRHEFINHGYSPRKDYG